MINHFRHSSILILFVSAFLLRMLVALYINTPLVSDDAEYHALGVSLAKGDGFILNNLPTAYRPPGYPVFLGICYWVFGFSPLAARCVQACVDTLTCLLLFLIGKNIFHQRIAFIATAILAFFPLHFLYVQHISTETFFTSLLLLSLWLIVRHWKNHQVFIPIVLSGLTLGLSTLIRPEAGLLILVAIWFFYNRTSSIKTNVLHATLLMVSFIVVLSPWLVRNQMLFGHCTLTSNVGLNFWIGNNPQANGAYSFLKADNPLLKEQDEFKQSDLGFRLAIDYIVQHPFTYPFLLLKKLAHLLSSDYGLMMSLQYRPEWSNYPNASLIYKELSIPLWILLQLPYVIVMVIGIIGMICQASERTRSVRLLLFVMFSFLIIHLIFFGGARFRMPMMPLLILFAASGWCEWEKGLLRFQGWRRTVTLILLITVFGIWFSEYYTLQTKLRQFKELKKTPTSFHCINSPLIKYSG